MNVFCYLFTAMIQSEKLIKTKDFIVEICIMESCCLCQPDLLCAHTFERERQRLQDRIFLSEILFLKFFFYKEKSNKWKYTVQYIFDVVKHLLCQMADLESSFVLVYTVSVAVLGAKPGRSLYLCASHYVSTQRNQLSLCHSKLAQFRQGVAGLCPKQLNIVQQQQRRHAQHRYLDDSEEMKRSQSSEL